MIMKLIVSTLLCLVVCLANSQAVADFENIQMPDESYLKDSGVDGGFSSGAVFLPNQYTDAGSFDFWSGWVISNLTDTITPGFINEASAYAGSGFNGSDNYAVCYAPSQGFIHSTVLGGEASGLYITNSTYTALSMRDGDAFAKKFGGSSGNDPDSLVVSFHAFYKGVRSVDSVLVYLADYTFEDNSKDYILKEWSYVDLSELGMADSIQCTMYSSDIGAFGINTPTYFCVDNVAIDILYANENLENHARPRVYPNPARDYIYLDGLDHSAIRIYNSFGQCVKASNDFNGSLDISDIAPGRYFIKIRNQVISFIKLP